MYAAGWSRAAVGCELVTLPFPQLAILLGVGQPQPCNTRALLRSLPGDQFLERQAVPLASLVERQQPRVHRGHDFGFADSRPSRCRSWRKVIESQPRPERPDRVG